MATKRQCLWITAPLLMGVWCVGGQARAHELGCEKTVDGQSLVVVDHYPATLTWRLTVRNTHPTAVSTVLSVSDPMLEARGFSWATPFDLDVGQAASATFDTTVSSFADCVALGGDPAPVALNIAVTQQMSVDNVMTAGWDLGEAQCTARVVCRPPDGTAPSNPPVSSEPSPPDGGQPVGSQPSGGQPVSGQPSGTQIFVSRPGESVSVSDQPIGPDISNPGGGPVVSRTVGFFETQPDVLDQCLAQGPIDIGGMNIDSTVAALGLLWGSPQRFFHGEPRSDLDRARFLAARQVLAAECNHRLFGGRADTIIAQTKTELRRQDCGRLAALESELAAFADAGSIQPLPGRWQIGSATPRAARDRGIDPTTPSGQSCR
jgi:hypothetical protein